MNEILQKRIGIFVALVALMASSSVLAQSEPEDRDPLFLSGKAALEDGVFDVAEKKFDAYLE